ncbi:MAG: prephenate dehydrogenase/arogenate dehydrogenase family protein [Spirochaetales bacterium]|nr:prephenate dehydrogenase/arogenate dehydrogenase family protein [Spirochaetales bacterium]
MKIGVYGLGRFGSFWASTLANDFEVLVYSRSEQHSVPEGTRRVSLEELSTCSAIFLCSAISATEPVLKSLLPHIEAETQIIDTCSVKVYPTSLMKKLLPNNEILGTHPMFGPDSAKNGVEGLPIVVTPLRENSKSAVFWEKYFSSRKMKVYLMTPEEHDKEAAMTQGITHFIGRTLNELGLEQSQIATKGYNSLLEIIKQTCNDPWQLFLDLQKYNPYTEQMRESLHEVLHDMLTKLDHIDILTTKKD